MDTVEIREHLDRERIGYEPVEIDTYEEPHDPWEKFAKTFITALEKREAREQQTLDHVKSFFTQK